MYLNTKNNFFHGIMFHHFHDEIIHTRGQGSISKDDFYNIINFIGKKNILDADIFLEKFKNKKLKSNEVCLTFDDTVKSQIDVALPVLEDLRIKSFFFVYTSVFEKNPDNLEIFRYFRMNYFKEINDFYDSFYKFLNKETYDFFEKRKEQIKTIKAKFFHYSISDIKFRLIRDFFLSKVDYEKIMFLMMSEKKFVPTEIYNKIFLNKNDLRIIDSLGHLVGLHSHSHPFLMCNLNFDEQKNEYTTNLNRLSEILGKPKNMIKFMSHPSGSFNSDTLEILKELGIEIGFNSSMTIEKNRDMNKINNSSLQIPRNDHADIFNIINN